jgi:hypothetical protein
MTVSCLSLWPIFAPQALATDKLRLTKGTFRRVFESSCSGPRTDLHVEIYTVSINNYWTTQVVGGLVEQLQPPKAFCEQ